MTFTSFCAIKANLHPGFIVIYLLMEQLSTEQPQSNTYKRAPSQGSLTSSSRYNRWGRASACCRMSRSTDKIPLFQPFRHLPAHINESQLIRLQQSKFYSYRKINGLGRNVNMSIKDNEGDINKHNIDAALSASRPTTVARVGGGASVIEHNLETKTG